MLVIVGLHATNNFAIIQKEKEQMPKPVLGAWSKAVNRLSGRLCVEFEDLNPGLRHAVYAELRNDSLNPVTVTNLPRVDAKLFDSSGKPVNTSGIAVGGPVSTPEWAVIPRDAYIGFRIDMQTVDVPDREQGMVLIAVGGKAWKTKAGKYVLQIVLTIEKERDGPQNQWIGELKLPPYEVLVTAEMLQMN